MIIIAESSNLAALFSLVNVKIISFSQFLGKAKFCMKLCIYVCNALRLGSQKCLAFHRKKRMHYCTCMKCDNTGFTSG